MWATSWTKSSGDWVARYSGLPATRVAPAPGGSTVWNASARKDTVSSYGRDEGRTGGIPKAVHRARPSRREPEKTFRINKADRRPTLQTVAVSAPISIWLLARQA